MKTLIIILSIYIFSVQTKLLYLLNGGESFSYLDISEQTILSIIWSLRNLIATALILYKRPRAKLVYLYAFLDGIAVLLYYFTLIPIWVGSFYFAIYTFVIIASTLAIKKESGNAYTQRELAKELGVSESKMSRAMSKINKK